MSTPSLHDLAQLDLSEAVGEETVRARLIDPLLRHLGYDSTDYEVWRNGDEAIRFRLFAPPVERGGRRIRSFDPDYVPTVRKRAFWVMDAKRPNRDAEWRRYVVQVLQYANHPELQARYAVLVDGIRLQVYDVRGFFFRATYDPVLDVTTSEIDARFAEVRALLGNEAIRERLVDTLVED